MAETIFGKIARGEIKANVVYEDELCIAFHDISAQAPVHVLLIPKEPIESVNDIQPQHAALFGHLWTVIPKLAAQLGIAESGYRVVVNCGSHGGQSVHHLHYHILGGRPLAWPPG
ncbi:MAG: histidine triad nucleotide-binding protein [Pirellulales bacterium]